MNIGLAEGVDAIFAKRVATNLVFILVAVAVVSRMLILCTLNLIAVSAFS